MQSLNQAMILTAGMSTRMLPLTQDIPKILLPGIGKNLFERMIEYTQMQGIASISMNVFHGKKSLLAQTNQWEQSHTGKFNIQTFEEEPIRGTGGGIAGMQSFIKDDHFAVINCDFLTEAVLKDMFKYHLQQNALATLLLIPVPLAGKYSTVQMDGFKKITSFKPTIPQRQIFAGIHIMSREIFQHFPTDHNFCIVQNVYKPLIEKGAPIFGYSKKAIWHDLGEVKLYHDSLFQLIQKPLAWMTDVKQGKSWIDPSLKIPLNVSYLNSILEKGIEFEGDTKLENCIVFPNTKVKPGHYKNKILTTTDIVDI